MPRSSITSASSNGSAGNASRGLRSQGATSNQKYGSVKYNRIPTSAKEDVHETISNPLLPMSAPFLVALDGVDEAKKLESPQTKKQSLGAANGGGVGCRLEAPSNNGHNAQKKHLALLPPSLHISFDVETDNDRSQKFFVGIPMSQSSDNVRRYQRFGSVSSAGAVSQSTCRPSAVIRRQCQTRNLLEQSDIAHISAGYMRASGAGQQFRRILAAPDKAPTLFSKMLSKQLSKDSGLKDKDDSSSATPIRKWSGFPANFFSNSLEEPKCATRAASIVDGDFCKATVTTTLLNGGMGPADAATAEATLDAFKLPTRRVGKRHQLFDQRRKACDYSCVFAVLGIVLMILENEFTAAGVYTKSCPYSYGLKSLIVLSTAILLALILAYHSLELQLSMVDLGCYDWRILINAKRVAQIILELSACGVCPIPGEYYFTWRTVHHDGKTVTAARVPVDVLLSIPMFLRLYLFCRLMLLHSKLFTDAPSRSIGAMNRVKFTARFVLKTLMTISPGTVLLTFTASFWMTAAWIMLLCERHHGYSHSVAGAENKTIFHYEAIKHQNYLNSLWLVAITSLTIGYGDIVPNTYCGRAVSVICGIMGAGTSSLVVAVVAKKLELSRAEKHVHNFMMDSLLTKKLKNAAANVLRETWLIYKYRKLVDKVDACNIRFHQRKFLIAIYELRRVKRGQRKLNENATTVADMAKTTSMMYEMIADMRSWQQEMEAKIASMDQRCGNVEAYTRQLQISIRVLPELVARKVHPSPSAISAMIFKPTSPATSLCDSHPTTAVQSTEAQNGSGYSSPE